MGAEYEKAGQWKRNPQRSVDTKSKTRFLKDEFILWGTRGNALGIKEKIKAKPDLVFNWEKIDHVRSLPEL